MPRRIAFALATALTASFCFAQEAQPPQQSEPAQAAAQAQPPQQESEQQPDVVTIPAGTKVLLALKNGINTKTARPGDGVYLETAFPLVLNGQMLVPAGTYVQGVIDNVKRPGKVKGRAQLLMHFTSMIFSNGTAVALPGALEGVPGSPSHRVKDNEGTVEQEGQKGRDAGTIASTTATGTLVGLGVGGGRGAAMGAGVGAVGGGLITLLTRGSDITIPPGTTIEMVFQRDLRLKDAQLRGVPHQYVPVDRQNRVLMPQESKPIDPSYRDLNSPVLIRP